MFSHVFIRNKYIPCITTSLAQPVRTAFLAHYRWNVALDCSYTTCLRVWFSLVFQGDPSPLPSLSEGHICTSMTSHYHMCDARTVSSWPPKSIKDHLQASGIL